MRARTGHAAHNLALLKQITLNLIRLDPTLQRQHQNPTTPRRVI
jgi:hypothetical protein